MAGPSTAERGRRQQPGSGPPRSKRAGRPRLPVPTTRQRRLAVLLLVLVVLLAGAAAWLLYGSSWLRVRQVAVSGTRVLGPDEIRHAAGVRIGSPMISVDTGAIEERLRRSVPRVATVEVSRSWPHGIGLKVTERDPVLLVEKSGKLTEVDAEGVRFATAGRVPEGLPRLELAASRAPSSSRFGTDRLIRAAAHVVSGLPAVLGGDARTVRVVKVRSYDSIVLELTGERTVTWGSSEDGPAKGRALTALMKAAPKARHFDVSAPTAPAASAS